MTTPEVGVTHDVVIYYDTVTPVGLLVKPYTYRVNIAPQYIPRLGDSDPRGADKARWRSFIQNDFSGGAGLAVWDGLVGPDRFAASSFVDLNVEHDRALPGPANDEVIVTAALTGATPRSTSGSGTGFVPKFFSEPFKGPWIFEMSNSPHMFQRTGVYVFTDHFEVKGFGAPEYGYDDLVAPFVGLPGKWADIGVADIDRKLSSATMFSNSVILAAESAVKIFTAVNASVGSRAIYQPDPIYSTNSSTVATYDDKLWRGYQNHITYLLPADDTYSARWADPISVGHESDLIQGMVEFNGRLYVGKKDALYIYDAGTVYKVEDFSEEPHDSNFRMMLNHRGALYFNIVDKVYRLTSEGTLEKLLIPSRNGYITGGCADDKDIIFTVRGKDQVHETWIFDTQTGGSRKWFKDAEGPHNVYGIYAPTSAMGHVWFAPMTWTWGPSVQSLGMAHGGHSSSVTDVPVTAVKRFAKGRNSYPAPELTGQTKFITAKLTLGHPNMTKLINRLQVVARTRGAGGSLGVGTNQAFFSVHYVLDPGVALMDFKGNEDALYEWVPEANWVLLGKVGSTLTERYSFTFPDDTTCEDILLRFTLQHGGGLNQGQISIQQYEIEYALAPSNLNTYDFTIVADDNMELLDMTKENSGEHIAVTVYSCAVSPKTFVVGIPWPTKHTIRGLVTIVTPGGAVPAPVYNTVRFDGGDIPIHIDEM